MRKKPKLTFILLLVCLYLGKKTTHASKCEDAQLYVHIRIYWTTHTTRDFYNIPLITDHPLIKLTINTAALIMLWLSAQRFAICHPHPLSAFGPLD